MLNFPDEFVNFTQVSTLDAYCTISLSIITFLVQLELLSILRYNRTIACLSQTLRSSATELLATGAYWIIVFWAFASVAYVLMGPRLQDYSSLGTIIVTLSSSTLGKFHFDSFDEAFKDRLLPRLFLLVYLLITILFVLNMFITILNEYISVVKYNPDIQPQEPEVFDYLVTQLKGLFVRDRDPIRKYSIISGLQIVVFE